MSPEVAGKLTDAFAAVDTIFREFHESGVTPDVAYGVIAEGRLHHAGGFGDTSLGVGPERRIYRIASMTKSFTASALLILRDRGLLALDAPVSDYVPELRDLALPTTDSSPITLRDLVTMSAGLPTDDPWADRMESMTAAAFSDLLREGFRFCSVPQSGFEYSNLGFAILGRAIANVSGAAYQDFVAATVLEPLGLVDTGYDAKTLDPDRLVVGHRRSQDRWEALPFSGPGEFSPIGGLFSTVSDLSRWVLYLLDAYPPRGDRDDGPLRRSSRREMQGMHRLDVVSAGLDLSAAPGRPARVNGVAEGYGFGLFVQRFTERGDVVSHSGGYPGFGSHMRWHPLTGLGVIGLANATYAAPGRPCAQALDVLLDAMSPPARRIWTWPETQLARGQVESLVEDFDDTLADAIFSVNMDLDVPRPARKAQLEAMTARAGLAAADAAIDVTSESPAHLSWRRRGSGADVQLSVGLNPEREPRIQRITAESIPLLSAVVCQAAARFVAGLTVAPWAWPTDLPVDEQVDIAWVGRLAAVAAGLGGPFELAADPVAVTTDGTATLLVIGPTSRWHLVLRLSDGGVVDQLDLRLLRASSDKPVEVIPAG